MQEETTPQVSETVAEGEEKCPMEQNSEEREENLAEALKEEPKEVLTENVTEDEVLAGTEDTAETPLENGGEVFAEVPVSDLKETEGIPEVSVPAPEAQAEMKDLLSKMNQLSEQFQERLSYDDNLKKANDRQYEELQIFRKGLLETYQKSLILDVVAEIDDSDKMYAAWKERPCTEENFEKLKKYFLEFSENLRILLERHDVTSWQSEPGTLFDPKKQTALKVTPTEDMALDKTLRQSLRRGFQTEEKILRRELVDVFVCKKPANENS